MISNLQFEDKAILMAKSSSAAYQNDCRDFFENLGFDQYMPINAIGTCGHVASNSKEVIIACRGTVFTDAYDIVSDLDIVPERHMGGWVHSGFSREARKILPDILKWVANNRGKDIYITGHSAGAAMALYIAQELEYKNYLWLNLFTYGSPRLGDLSYVSQIKLPHWRFVNCNDVVPHLPPEALMFVHHGIPYYIDFYGNQCKSNKQQRIKDHIRGRIHAWKKLQLFDRLADHAIENYIKKLEYIKEFTV
jgi:triacylglycerol lipase